MLAWAALIIVNFGLYMASLVLLVQSLRRVFSPDLALLLAMYPALHRDTVGFLFVPTAEPFNLLLPAIFLYTSWCFGRNPPGYSTAFAVGLGMLGKGLAFIIVNWPYEYLIARDCAAIRACGAFRDAFHASHAGLLGNFARGRHTRLQSRDDSLSAVRLDD